MRATGGLLGIGQKRGMTLLGISPLRYKNEFFWRLIILTAMSGNGFFCDQEKSTVMFLTFPGVRCRRKRLVVVLRCESDICCKKGGSDIATASS